MSDTWIASLRELFVSYCVRYADSSTPRHSNMIRRSLALLLPLAISGCGYNRIQTLDEQAAQAKQQIEVQLQRRADLVPNLVNTVKGYAAHEEAVFTQVANARAGLAGAIRTGDPAQQRRTCSYTTSDTPRYSRSSVAQPRRRGGYPLWRRPAASPLIVR